MPSRPGEFHPESLTEPDLILSHHPARAIARRLPPSASLSRACRNLVPTFPQRSPPLLLTTAACGGLRSAPDCRPRRTYLHLSYSYAPPCGPALLVTQDPSATLAVHCGNGLDAGFSPYQGTRLSPYNAVSPELGSGYASARVHHASRRCGCGMARSNRRCRCSGFSTARRPNRLRKTWPRSAGA